MIDRYEFDEEPEEYSPPIRLDSYFIEAQAEIRKLYEEDKDSVYYMRQLQVKFEKKYFHWVTNNAVIGLLKIGYLKDLRIARETGTSTRFFIRRSNRYPKRDVKQLEELVAEYSKEHITRSCGHRAEDLFLKALAMRGFMPRASKVKEYDGKKWTKTGHDLDFVFERDGISYGCEIKNTLGYIDKIELDIKLEMCSHLGIRPLFIMRYSPKTYNNIIFKAGGFSLIFETQIYELSQQELVNKVKNVLGLPAICSTGIQDGIIDRFEQWHMKNL